MGKGQSKRSVDITAEPKDGNNAEVLEGTAGKLGKIEDVDQLKTQQKQQNGDTNHSATAAAATATADPASSTVSALSPWLRSQRCGVASIFD